MSTLRCHFLNHYQQRCTLQENVVACEHCDLYYCFYHLQQHQFTLSLISPHFSSSPLNTTYCVRPSSSLPSFSPSYISPATPIPTSISRYNTLKKATTPVRFSKHHFHFRNIQDNKDYTDIYLQIFNCFKNNLKYLCVLSTSTAAPTVSIHLMFKVRPNYKRLFLDNILPNATRVNYEEILDDNDFKEEIKFNNDHFTESSSYISLNIKKQSSRKNSDYFQQRSENAALALQQTTVSDGNIVLVHL
ncbi:unnamed protein product [Didymodactylos carnosus]|uniref:Uncharacterized protein n=1 Tax=Didymodactylos carnosus TaxID=1234261 RepID=A0A8S2EBB8_9BILA|nr:unnamed protein product [Didymodactylos carnosus]CAF3864450.1 unnamed protein product [Didymodactylos carnosus]